MKSKKLNKPSRSEGIQPGKRITSDIRPWKYMVIDGTDTAIFPFISVQIKPKNERAKIKMFAKKCKIKRELYCKKMNVSIFIF